MSQRTATRARQTKETKIEVAVNLDGTGDYVSQLTQISMN